MKFGVTPDGCGNAPIIGGAEELKLRTLKISIQEIKWVVIGGFINFFWNNMKDMIEYGPLRCLKPLSHEQGPSIIEPC